MSSLSINAESLVPPKVFISYSWTTLQHQEQIRMWAERLISDGIAVTIDIFDLKEGHDKYQFMERMVTDVDITHVLVFSDKRYAEKADSRKAGVGTESQIISSEVYAKTEQSKFIPVVCQFDKDGEPFLPVFLKPRIWIDFSSPEATNKNWEQLVRLLYGKPFYQKPQIGKPPAYITADADSPCNPAIGKFAALKQAVLSNATKLALYRDDFLSACIDYASSFRVKTSPNSSFGGEQILEQCGKLVFVRNQIVDWVLLEGGISATEEFQEALIKFLETMLELKSRPLNMNRWNETWFEAERLFVYETFLYIVAALLKKSSYDAVHQLLSSYYIRPESDRYSERKFDNFGMFYASTEMLQTVLSHAGIQLYSPAAELLKKQADRTDLTFDAIIEADLLVTLMALINPEARWYPQTIYYSSRNDFPLFLRATQHKYFLKLSIVTGIDNVDDLREAAKAGYERLRIDTMRGLWMLNHSLWVCWNIDKLDSLK